ncbi:MAG: translation initiation factor IF-2 [Deferrisomatales bacterium]|nr:translation initiation factor IF-2 [Deferrisomatales bacterium]
MAKVRVFEAAKDSGHEVQDLLAALTKLGVKVRSHLSPVDEEDIQQALKTLGGALKAARKGVESGEATAKPQPVVRRRRKAAEPDEVSPQAETPTAAPETAEAAEPGAAGPVAEEPRHGADAAPLAPGAEPDVPEAAAEGAAEPAEAPAPEAKETPEPAKDEFGLKVVRFIHPPPEERAPAAAPVYHMNKQEREASRAARKSKKKKGRREAPMAARPDLLRTPQRTQITVPKASKRRIRITEVIALSDLSQRMGVKATELIKKLMSLGVLATINQTVDADTAALVAAEFGYEVENIAVAEEEFLARSEDRPEELEHRPPVVTVMGHVDHGKTSLLDAIRKTRVAAGEAGGITQHIGAYAVETSRGPLVFLDTPGHEAFTALRARGAKLTDITVLVVAADDGIMPQTVEAIDHSKAAKVPIIVAVNKMDKPEADPDRVKRGLTEQGLVPEDWGGDVICVPVSAKQGMGIDQLLEMIALQAEIMELTANPKRPARGTVIEARIDRGRGAVATVLVQEGTLKVGDILLAGMYSGRIRSLTNDQGKRVKEAGPSTPVEVTGIDGVPTAGEAFLVVDSERAAREVAGRRAEKSRDEEMAKARKVTLADLHTRISEGEIKELPVIVKADVQGSVEALAQALEKIATSEVKIRVIHGAVGGITENDVNLAHASQAIVVGFNVRPEAKAAAIADQAGVDVRLYSVIYDATDDLRKALGGLLAPTRQERVLGRTEVRQIFKIPKAGTVAGCYVTQGVAQRNARVRLLRESVVIYTGELASLKRFKDDVREVREGFECGLSIQNYNDVKEGDVVEFFVIEEIERTL